MKNKFGIYLMIGIIFILFLCSGFYIVYTVLSYNDLYIGTYIFFSLSILGYFILAYIILTRILFRLKFRNEMICYFNGDKLYTSNHLFPIDTDKIEKVVIKSTSKYRSNRAYKVSIKLKGRFFKYTFGIGHISEDKEQKKYDYFLKELKKRHIDYEIK
ncbi:MAG: hypothetical protein HXM96_02520 [Parvimonas sp.]|uniref:hypothetical protein n=1 Tax=Parvimonas sp. TaxID=1944660 RepID=UPI001CB02AF1|nr:hypothetical protein [Parvimonas sp.]MBF1294963.1 hypothetical protein [Parvimonas sp.]MBF1300035.1 hypothetical protein [Parvimonas sp.]